MRFLPLVLVACTAASADEASPYAPAALKAHVAQLAAPALDGRAPGTAGDRRARAYIAARFRALGLTTSEQAFTHGDATTGNVIAYRPGSDPELAREIILVGAHHDHLGGGHLGANDNASGVAGLLAVAAEVAALATAPKRTVAFVTFGAEEAGLVGSAYFVGHMPAELPLSRVVQFVNLDMIGSHASKRAVYAFGAFGKLPATAMLRKLARSYARLNVRIGGHSVRGDQAAFCQAGIPYVFFWTPDTRCYHAKCDTVGKLDLRRMADIAALAGGLVRGLADSSVDLAATRKRHGCRPGT